MTGTVFVFGSINADTSYKMTALPAPGETVIASTALTSPGGKGANQAMAAAAAGAATCMVGVVGDDAEGSSLLGALSLRGVDTASVSRSLGAATGSAVVCVDESGENTIVVLSGANALINAEVATIGLESISNGDVLVLQNEVPAEANRAAAHLARTKGAMVIWNAAPAPTTAADLVNEIDLLVVNENELIQISNLIGTSRCGKDSPCPGLGDLLTQCARELGVNTICTLGAAGAMFYVGGRLGTVPAPQVLSIDSTAAGDTVVGYLAAHAGIPVEEQLYLATAAGALAVTRVGASLSIPHLDDVRLMLADVGERPLT